ncbi:A disintegrin and metalloproteinase with thrombospondin motifs 20-like isoform X1 [Hemiscyllium ocellatum]|uniref:A disintegrin and metalloproteinase with thrombospondin motifs 20-like isoform X1 n=2 Tax=Hemiscyllium ocellatum TaxID=170820 RepID=UPI00296760F2|nr:A disintegrin and metalloproteinase with thrombospondin motifs 20-like isoform X1 [Hemiscyllium ocellatum]
MQLMLWVKGLLSQLLVFIPLTRELRLHPQQESFVRQLSSYEITSPRRLNDFGEAFPHTHHFRRRKRSPDSEPWASRTHYQLHAFGQLYRLNLSAHSDFIAATYRVRHLGRAEPGSPDSDLKHCFYRGHVNSERRHTVVVSLCTGIMGTFQTSDGQYFLEPLMKPDGGQYEDEHNKPHLIYKHGALNSNPLGKTSHPCATFDQYHQRKKRLVKMHKASSFREHLDILQTAIRPTHPQTEETLLGNATQQHSRQKRFLSYPRFVEIMVTADNKMAQHHGRNLQHYILTLMSIVAAIYRDPSVGNLINIVIVKLNVIHNEQEGPSISFNAATTLHNFCVWQQTHNILDDAHPSHHDTAVLITREDICRARNKCDTLGLAELGTMCDPYRSCSISEENGLSAAFTIAHELGHVFNMPHDDSFKCKEAGMKHQFHVMAPTLNYHTSPWTWSKCSRKYITDFLDTGYGECLLDEPVTRSYDLPVQLPGQIYDVNKQCELMFGAGSQVCPYMKQCKRLWCTSVEGVHRGCRTQHMPLADGTDCGHGMHCRHGICVNKEMAARPVDGEWGPWGSYGACSRTCGGGIRSAVRDCNKPEPRNGGKYCVGRRMKFRSCNTEPCPKGRKDFREEQCSEFDGKHFNINGLPPNVRWLPKYSGILMKDRCKLFCRVAGTTAYYQLKDRATDGTPCGPDTNDVCVQGLCRQAGCDHVLNSKARRDKCGVCGGDNSSCRTLAGTFNNAQYGYNIVVRIPSGATNIDVRQHSYSGKPEDDNYLALSDSRGNFILNGNFVVSMFKREINVQGATIEYSGSDNDVERINCTDRIEEELILQVLSVGNLYNPDVRYSFNIPIEDQLEKFVWDPYGSWQQCSRLCQGERRRKVVCVRKSDHLVVSDQRCEHLPRPVPDIEPCNTECEVRWHTVGKSECTAQCGPGYRTQDIRCMKYTHGKGPSESIDDRYCRDQPKPPSREPCHGDCHRTSWHYTSWSQCSKTCGGGTRTREGYCMSNLGRHLVNQECNEHQNVVSQVCNEFPCPEWTASEWSECLVTCGKGTRHRQVSCLLNNEQLQDDFCNPSIKPEAVGSCELQECASWQVGVWGQCAATCGHGYQMRAVRCVVGAYGAVIDDRECNAATRPRDSQECEMPPCLEPSKIVTTTSPAVQRGMMTQWRYGSWTPCSVTCGKGARARYVSCRDAQGGIADESFCAHLPRPPETMTCFSPCGQWHAGEWSPCSVSCGSGRVTRQVVCTSYHHQITITDESDCNAIGKPHQEQECSMPPCPPTYHQHDYPAQFPQRDYPQTHADYPSQDVAGQNTWNSPSRGSQWRTGPWGACSSTCTGGFQRRVVVCQDAEGRPANNCDERVKPAETRHCDAGTCPHWNYGNWGECTQPCDGGTRTRLVICQLPTGQRLNDQNCDILEKPPDREQCNVHPCPGGVLWHRGPWNSCSVSCGKGTKQRDVHCIDMKQVAVDNSYCQHLKKPRVNKQCRTGRCPAWKATRWKECSVTCGVGYQQREVFCRLKGVGRISEETCDPFSRPAVTQQCRLPDCLHYEWLADEWEDCSASCGQGIQNRKVLCVNHIQKQVEESYCNHSARPPSMQNCIIAACEYIWITGEWSQCSTSCGSGYQQRMVYCTEVHSGQDHYSYDLPSTSINGCPGPPPPNIHECNVRECRPIASWRVGAWSKCSVTCGVGIMERKVQCLTDNSQLSELCLPNQKPQFQTPCFNDACDVSASCSDIQKTKEVQKDGEYLLKIEGKIIKIYCAGMHSDYPREYITLLSGEADNYSEVYGYRLHNPYECPYNGNRRKDCSCKHDYLAAGYTVFHRIRFDISTMQIIITDLHFAQTVHGRSVPFATAGDCYSAAKCPQGQFSINLSGTGLKISEASKWIAQGNYATVNVHRSPDGTKVYGRCGGYCGKCVPQTSTGLLMQVQ